MLYCALVFTIFILLFTYALPGEVILPYKDNKILEYCKSNQNELTTTNIFENSWYLIVLIILSCIFLLLFLGLLKGLFGMCYKSIGELGLGLLVDIPRPLEKYREASLLNLPVQYDIEGWPIHPYKNERTVRLFSKKTEFCLNIIFFLAYPLALSVHLCSLMCCAKKVKQNEKACFKSVSLMKMNERLKKKKEGYKLIGNFDIYDNDRREDEDTQYVISQMRQSQLSLQKGY